jgi:hypothetical protein
MLSSNWQVDDVAGLVLPGTGRWQRINNCIHCFPPKRLAIAALANLACACKCCLVFLFPQKLQYKLFNLSFIACQYLQMNSVESVDISIWLSTARQIHHRQPWP